MTQTMTLNEIEKHAKALMTTHGVGSLEFAFDRGRKRMGATWFTRIGDTYLPFKITLSRYLAVHMTHDELRDTMLHEIAHALAGKKAGHGPTWKRHALAIGCKATRCGDVQAKPDYPVHGYCTTCEQTVVKQFRLPLRVYWCVKCSKTGRVSIGSRGQALQWYKDGVHIPTESMPARYRAEFNREPAPSRGGSALTDLFGGF